LAAAVEHLAPRRAPVLADDHRREPFLRTGLARLPRAVGFDQHGLGAAGRSHLESEQEACQRSRVLSVHDQFVGAVCFEMGEYICHASLLPVFGGDDFLAVKDDLGFVVAA
jgi:hypothetical protein